MTPSLVQAVRAVFLGAPGAGKGTQAKRLADEFGAAHISTGDMLRAEVANQSGLGTKAKSYMDAGSLVPDELIISMVAQRIHQPDVGGVWILDGFPRTLPQAEALDATAKSQPSLSLTHVIYFAVPEVELVQRLSGRWTCGQCGSIWNTATKPPQISGVCDRCAGALVQRVDDRPEAVRQRLQVYEAQTAPLLSYYKTRGLLSEVDANRPSDAVFSSLIQILGPSSNA